MAISVFIPLMNMLLIHCELFYIVWREEMLILKTFSLLQVSELWWLLGLRYDKYRGAMVIVVGNGHSEILDEADCISHSTNTFRKGMNPVILPPVMVK